MKLDTYMMSDLLLVGWAVLVKKALAIRPILAQGTQRPSDLILRV